MCALVHLVVIKVGHVFYAVDGIRLGAVDGIVYHIVRIVCGKSERCLVIVQRDNRCVGIRRECHLIYTQVLRTEVD